MTRPTNKTELVAAAETGYTTLVNLIDSMTEEERNGVFPFEDRDRSLRDILIHLYEWHKLFLHWLTENQNGRNTPFLPNPYNWRTYPQMNIVFWEKHQQTPLCTAQENLACSHREVMALTATFSDDDVFAKKRFAFTGSTSLGSYAVSATSAHYDWAIRKLKKYLNSRKK